MKTKYDYWANAKNELCKPTVLDGRLSATRLADSAPDLLAALEYWFDSKATPQEIAIKARAAIAKAKGE